jgi:hypothetical protein
MARRTTNDIRSSSATDNFYEAMPLSAMPHSLYRDDQPGASDSDERFELTSRLTALVTLAALMLVVLGLAILMLYGFNAVSNAQSPASQSSGSLEL